MPGRNIYRLPLRPETGFSVLALHLGAALFVLGCSDSTDLSNQTSEKKPPALHAVDKPVEIEPSTAIATLPIDPQESWEKMDDPSSDGWDSEVLAEYTGAQLDRLGALFFEEGDLASLLAAGFACEALVPHQLELAFEDDAVKVERSVASDVNRGGDDLERTMASVRAIVKGTPGGNHFKFKITRVELDETDPKSAFTTEQYFSLTYRTTQSIVEHHATWVVGWRREGDALKILDIRVPEFERTTTKRVQPLFSDCTESALASNASYSQQLAYGMNHWLGRLPVRAMLNRFGTPGVAIGDVNGDGLDDLYLCQEPGLPNRLFLQNPDGTAKDVSAEWGVDWIEDSRSALLVDLDNDGDQDLVVATYGNVVIARNEDGKRFKVATALPASGSTASLAAADYDSDGWLDLFVCGYVEDDSGGSIGAAAGGRFVYHDAENGAANSLFHNESAGAGGELAFADVTQATGLDQNNSRWSFAASWEDFDDDGDQDLYVANDYGRNNLYRNESEPDGRSEPDGQIRFLDIAATAGVEDSASGMSVSWGDYDRDGHMDVYVSNMFSAAGSRITSQNRFKTGTDDKIRDRFRRFARGNSLFRNSRDREQFEDVSITTNVTLGRWAWGSNFVDLNNDSWLDLVVANGYLSSDDDTGDL
ncbi:MAG: hypothetical protein ACI9R3_001376 [Verrucomicrobiales bacterium]|jgi:hypothetical protein